MTIKQLQSKILDLKVKNDVTILAHYYQPIEIQEIADHVGDSLGLSRIAKEKANTEYIIFAGVLFMAETASILNQHKHVLIPNPESCCPMAGFLTADKVLEFKENNPNKPVVVYVNSTAAVKAEADVCCTSSNCVNITKNISKEFNSDSVLFGPDANLADYVEQISGIKTIKMPDNGHCIVHSQLKPNDIINQKNKYPTAKILVHPECTRAVRELADIIGSTAKMYKYVKSSTNEEDKFIIGTEIGLLERMKLDFPNKEYFLASEKMICYNMKKHNLELIEYVLTHLDDKSFEVKVPEKIAKKALIPIDRMLLY